MLNTHASTPEPTDHVLPEGKWSFDADVTHIFENMLVRSIPQYEVMRRAVFELGSDFVKEKTDIVDLGSARGEALAPFVDRFGAYNRFIGIEISPPMLQAARARFEGYIQRGIVEIRQMDLRREYPACLASLTLAVLVVQFTPIEYRLRLMREIYRHTLPGGALILVEKVLGNSADLDAELVKRYYALKADNGYSAEEIERKRLSLEGVLVPVTAKWNEELLNMAGFEQVDCFWRWMNFAGWVAIKG